MHINQIYSMLDLAYPERLKNKDKNTLEKRYRFRNVCLNYILDDNGRQNMINPFNKKEGNDTTVLHTILSFTIEFLGKNFRKSLYI